MSYRVRRFAASLAVFVVCAAIVSGGIGLLVTAVADDYLPAPDPQGTEQSGPQPTATDTSSESASPQRERSPEPSPTPSTSSTPPTKPPSPVQVTGVRAYDPLGDGREHSDEARLAIDDNPVTAWRTEHYSSANFGSLKSGVGLLIDLGQPRTVRAVDLRMLPGGGSTFQLRAGNTANSLDQLDTVATVDDANVTLTVDLEGSTKARYWLVWFTQLPARGDNYRGGISEISLTN